MGKKLMVFFAAAFALAGCSADKATAPTHESSKQTSQSSQEMVQESSESSIIASSSEQSAADSTATEEDDDLAPVSEEEAANAEKVTDVSQYEEITYAQDKVDLSGYESRVLSDNPGTRVMLFIDGDKQVYKTVYVKHNNWLKVIDLQANDLVLNESIK